MVCTPSYKNQNLGGKNDIEKKKIGNLEKYIGCIPHLRFCNIKFNLEFLPFHLLSLMF